MKWIPVSERLPPDNWRGLIVADVRPDRPVFAHTADEHYRKEFPFDDYFIGPWRESLLIGNHMRDKAKVTYWLEGLVIPEPPGGTMKPDMKEIPCDELQQLMKKLGTPDEEWQAFIDALPAKYWAKYDLSALRLGWEAAKDLLRDDEK